MNKRISYMNNSISLKKSIRFHMIPYHLQYETRDCTLIPVSTVSQVTIDNRKKYIKEFNPYLGFHVSSTLDDKLMEFYKMRYGKR